MASQIVKLQVSLTAYGRPACTLYGGIKTETGDLLILDAIDQLEPKKDASYLKVGSPGSTDSDAIFTDADMRAAIDAWRQMQGLSKIRLKGASERHNPDNKMQVAKVGEGGLAYEISPDATNGNIACLAMAWIAQRQVVSARSVSFSRMVGTRLYQVPGFDPYS